MANYYSDHFGPAVGETGHFTTLEDPFRLLGAGQRHGRLRHSHCTMIIPSGQDLADNDVIALLKCKSSDRIGELLVMYDANFGTTSPYNVGLYELGSDGDVGTVIDEDLFTSAKDFDSGAAFTREEARTAATDIFLESTSLNEWDRWKQLWEMVNVATPSTYDVDPIEDWIICMTASSNPAATAGATNLLMEMFYKSGD